MLLVFIHWPQEGIPTSGYSQSVFRKGGLKNPIPSLGGGEALGFEFISKPLLCPWGEDIKNWRQIFHRERVRKLSHGVNTPVRRMPLFVGWNPEMRESICRALVKVSTQKELAIFCWSLGRRISYTVEFSSKLSSRIKEELCQSHANNIHVS